MAKKLISEVLTEASKIIKKTDRMSYLRAQNSGALRDILRIQFDADVVSVLPEGKPPYKSDDAPEGYQYDTLLKAHRRFKYFFKGPVANQVDPIRRESLFIQLLESIHADDAEMLIAAKDRKLNYKGITSKFVSDTFPGLLVKPIKGGKKV
tara:strand:- start:3021 stop:3473 length:453 start_codon:yes stop_codon:yes gene_type:complete